MGLSTNSPHLCHNFGHLPASPVLLNVFVRLPVQFRASRCSFLLLLLFFGTCSTLLFELAVHVQLLEVQSTRNGQCTYLEVVIWPGANCPLVQTPDSALQLM